MLPPISATCQTYYITQKTTCLININQNKRNSAAAGIHPLQKLTQSTLLLTITGNYKNSSETIFKNFWINLSSKKINK